MVILDAQTIATTSLEFTINGRYRMPPAAKSYNIVGAEYATLQMKVGSNWVDVKQNGNAVQLTANTNSIPIDQVGKYRFNKSITAGAATIVLEEEATV